MSQIGSVVSDGSRGGEIRIGMMRHVRQYDPYDAHSEAERVVDPVATSAGATEARQAGRLLREVLDEPEPPSKLIVLHPGTLITKRTAELLVEGFSALAGGVGVELIQLGKSSAGTPAEIAEEKNAARLLAGKPLANTAEAVAGAKRVVLAFADKKTAVIVVGHDPPSSWLMHEFVAPSTAARSALRRAITAVGRISRAVFTASGARLWLHQPDSLPLRRGEIIMLSVSGIGTSGAEPVWSISPGSDELIAELRTKVSAKMDSAKQLGAFATALLTFSVTGILQEKPMGGAALASWAGVAVLGVAVVAFFGTLFRYDSLLMPSAMWASSIPKKNPRRELGVFRRPPSSAAWVLFQNMQLIWLRGFTVACFATAVGGTLVVVGLANPQEWQGWGITGGLLALTLGLGGIIWRSTRPVLGVND